MSRLFKPKQEPQRDNLVDFHPKDELLLDYAAAALLEQEAKEFAEAAQEVENLSYDFDALDQRVYANLAAAQAKAKKAKRLSRLKLLGKTAAVFVIAVLLSGGLLYNTTEAFRIEIKNIFYSIRETFTSVSVQEEVTPEDVSGFPLQATYLPPNFMLLEEKEYYVRYEDSNGHFIDIECFPHGVSTNIDSENATYEEIEVNENLVQLYTKDGEFAAVWRNGDETFSASGNIELEEFIRFLEGLEAKA